MWFFPRAPVPPAAVDGLLDAAGWLLSAGSGLAFCFASCFTVRWDPFGLSRAPFCVEGREVRVVSAEGGGGGDGERERRAVAFLYRWCPEPDLEDWRGFLGWFGLAGVPRFVLGLAPADGGADGGAGGGAVAVAIHLGPRRREMAYWCGPHGLEGREGAAACSRVSEAVPVGGLSFRRLVGDAVRKSNCPEAAF